MTDVQAYTRYLEPHVAEMIAAEVGRWHGGAVETAWCGEWDFERERVTSARLLFRGNNGEVAHVLGDVQRGQVDIHNHPVRTPNYCYPSEADTKIAAQLGAIGAGMLIVSHDCRDGYLVRAPRQIQPKAPGFRLWSARFGRWTLMAGYRNRRLHP